jgi:predicted nucleic acid-binding protein
MILVDTSVWIDHFRSRSEELAELLETESALIHPFVIGELACGNLQNRNTILADLNELPRVVAAEHLDVLTCIDERKLFGTGIGWVDAHLIASALITGAKLWTADGALNRAARSAGIAFR